MRSVVPWNPIAPDGTPRASAELPLGAARVAVRKHERHDATVIESAEEFVALRTSDRHDEYVRAANEPASDAVWFEVIDRYPDMRKWVAHNKTTSGAVLERLAADSDPSVRYRVAMANRAEASVLRVLAGDPDESVRARVARHRHAPSDVIDALRNDSSAVVRGAVPERHTRRT